MSKLNDVLRPQTIRVLSRHHELLLMEIGLQALIDRESDWRRQGIPWNDAFTPNLKREPPAAEPVRPHIGRPRKYPTKAAALKAQQAKNRERSRQHRQAAKAARERAEMRATHPRPADEVAGLVNPGDGAGPER